MKAFLGWAYLTSAISFRLFHKSIAWQFSQRLLKVLKSWYVVNVSYAFMTNTFAIYYYVINYLNSYLNQQQTHLLSHIISWGPIICYQHLNWWALMYYFLRWQSRWQWTCQSFPISPFDWGCSLNLKMGLLPFASFTGLETPHPSFTHMASVHQNGFLQRVDHNLEPAYIMEPEKVMWKAVQHQTALCDLVFSHTLISSVSFFSLETGHLVQPTFNGTGSNKEVNIWRKYHWESSWRPWRLAPTIRSHYLLCLIHGTSWNQFKNFTSVLYLRNALKEKEREKMNQINYI